MRWPRNWRRSRASFWGAQTPKNLQLRSRRSFAALRMTLFFALADHRPLLDLKASLVGAAAGRAEDAAAALGLAVRAAAVCGLVVAARGLVVAVVRRRGALGGVVDVVVVLVGHNAIDGASRAPD